MSKKPVIRKPSTADFRQSYADYYIKWLREGKPELGWSGDPFLVLAFARIEQRWELWRHEPEPGNPDRHVMIAAGPPGAELNDDAVNLLIRRLVAGDMTRRGNSAEAQLDRVVAHNERLHREREAKAADMMAEKLEPFYHEVAKAYGLPKTHFGYGD